MSWTKVIKFNKMYFTDFINFTSLFIIIGFTLDGIVKDG